MTRTNYGNGYKFQAIMKRRSSNSNTVMIQCMKKDGTWGKAMSYKKYGNETDAQVVERLIKNNNKPFRLAE